MLTRPGMYPPPELVHLASVRAHLAAAYVARLSPRLELGSLAVTLAARPEVVAALEREAHELAHLERARRVRFRPRPL